MSSSAIRRAAPANPANAAVATAQIFSFLSNSALACTVPARGKGVLDGRQFRVRAEGNLLTAVGTTTAKPQLLVSGTLPASPLVIGNWTALAAGAGVASPTTGCPWWAEASLIYDSISGLMHGYFWSMVNNSLNAIAAITGVLTGINGLNQPVTQGGSPVQPQDPVAYFAVGLTFSAAGANVANLVNFEVGF